MYTYLHIQHLYVIYTVLYLKYRMALGIAKASDSWECLQNVSVIWLTTWYLSKRYHTNATSVNCFLPQGTTKMAKYGHCQWTHLQLPGNTFNLTGVTKGFKQHTQTDTHHWQCPTWLPTLLSPLTQTVQTIKIPKSRLATCIMCSTANLNYC